MGSVATLTPAREGASPAPQGTSQLDITSRLVRWCLVGSLFALALEAGFAFQLAPADLLVVPLAFALFRSRYRDTADGLALYVAMVVIALAIAYGYALYSAGSWRGPVLSVGFFLKSWILYFAAYRHVATSVDPTAEAARLLRWASRAQVALLAVVMAGYWRIGTMTTESVNPMGVGVRAFSAGLWDEDVRIYGLGQVNTTAGILALATPIFLYRVSTTTNVVAKAAWVALIGVSWFAIVEAASRGGLATVGLFVVAALFVRGAQTGRVALIRNLMVVAVIALGVGTQTQRILDSSQKFQQTVNNVREGQISAVSSGRDFLLYLMVEDIRADPLTGTRFQGFALRHSDLGQHVAESSPHNTYVGPIFKGGLLVGVPYLLLLIRTVPARFWSRVPGGQWLTGPTSVAAGVGLFPVGDALTTPVLAATLLIYWGALNAADAAPEVPSGALQEVAHRPM